MIKSFKHKGLENFFIKGDTKGVNPNHVSKLTRILGQLNQADNIKQLNAPGNRLHEYKGQKDLWSIDVSGNYRILFKFENGEVFGVDYLDPH